MNKSLKQVFNCLSNKQSFLLEAGAGSGKTWSLIETLKYLLETYQNELEVSNTKIVCITYTNIAKDEISERINNNPLVIVETIHEFLWDVIKNYQFEIKQIIIETNKISKKPVDNLNEIIADKEIAYSMYGRNFNKGRISHNEIITFSSHLFKSYPKISKIVSDQYPYIFVDEYQDTEERTVELLVDYLLEANKGKITLGFFGDSMQKIYNQGIGSINKPQLTTITKDENFRCSLEVIGLLNKIRTNISQIPTGKNKKGAIKFIYSDSSTDKNYNYKKTIQYLKEERMWGEKGNEFKILMLTHKGIAEQLDYQNILNLYSKKLAFGRDRLYEKEEMFSNFFLEKVEKLVFLYSEKRYSEFIEMLGIEGFQLEWHSDKKRIKNSIEELNTLRKKGSIKEVYKFVLKKNLITKPDNIIDFEERIFQDELDEKGEKDKLFYEELMQIKYSEIEQLNAYIEEYTPFSTKHGVKGAEYENVLVVLDDKAWNQYNFDEVFSKNKSKLNRFNRTTNLLYVSCSRAKNELVLLSQSKLSDISLQTIKVWFKDENLLSIQEL